VKLTSCVCFATSWCHSLAARFCCIEEINLLSWHRNAVSKAAAYFGRRLIGADMLAATRWPFARHRVGPTFASLMVKESYKIRTRRNKMVAPCVPLARAEFNRRHHCGVLSWRKPLADFISQIPKDTHPLSIVGSAVGKVRRNRIECLLPVRRARPKPSSFCLAFRHVGVRRVCVPELLERRRRLFRTFLKRSLIQPNCLFGIQRGVGGVS
jgi:hypothetical protein